MKSTEQAQVPAEQLPSVREEADHDEGRRSLDLESAVGAAHAGAFRHDRRAHANKRARLSIAAFARSIPTTRARSARTDRQRRRTSVVRWPSGTDDRGVHRQHRPRCHSGVEVYRPRANLAEHPVAFGGRRQLLEPLDQALQPRASTCGREGKIRHGVTHSTRLRRNAQSQWMFGPRCRPSRAWAGRPALERLRGGRRFPAPTGASRRCRR